jgi:hypothetical protein
VWWFENFSHQSGENQQKGVKAIFYLLKEFKNLTFLLFRPFFKRK